MEAKHVIAPQHTIPLRTIVELDIEELEEAHRMLRAAVEFVEELGESNFAQYYLSEEAGGFVAALNGMDSVLTEQVGILTLEKMNNANK